MVVRHAAAHRLLGGRGSHTFARCRGVKQPAVAQRAHGASVNFMGYCLCCVALTRMHSRCWTSVAAMADKVPTGHVTGEARTCTIKAEHKSVRLSSLHSIRSELML